MSRLLTLSRLLSLRSRGNRARLIAMAAGIAIGTMLLLLVLAAHQGLSDRSLRGLSLQWVGGEHEPVRIHDAEETAEEVLAAISAGTRPAPDEFIVLSSGFIGASEPFQHQRIMRVDVAIGGNSTVQLPGIVALPGPGEYLASPAAAALIDETPRSQLGDRYGVRVGEIGDQLLTSPDDLLVMVGHDPLSLSSWPQATLTQGFVGASAPPQAYQTIAVIGGIAVLFPVVVLIRTVTQLGHSARSDRAVVLRLLGASPGTVAAVAAIETAVVTLIGAVLGTALYWLVLPLAAKVSVEGKQFFVADLMLPWQLLVAVSLSIVLIAAATAAVTAHRTRRGSLGSSREQPETRPSLMRLAPLGLGIVMLLGIVAGGWLLETFETLPLWFTRFINQGVSLMFIPSFLLIMAGIVIAGPLLMSTIARWLARRTSNPSALLALSRLYRHPAATFRTVTGIVVALFVVTVFAVGMTAEQRADNSGTGDAIGFTDESGALVDEDSFVLTPVAEWQELQPNARNELISAAQRNGLNDVSVSVSDPPMVIINTDGTPAGIERVRTALMNTPEIWALGTWGPYTLRELNTPSSSGTFTWAGQYANLAYLGMFIALALSAVTLAVSVIGGVIDRKRSLGLLRLTGMPIRQLRAMMTYEAFVPVAAMFAICIGLGAFVASALITGLSSERTVAMPGASYFLTLAAGISLTALAVTATFQTVGRATAVTTTRFE